MAELKCGFYNAVLVDGQPDRVYNADEVNKFLEGLVSENGIYATISTACQVVSGSGMQVIVKEGKGIVNNHWFKVESDITLDIEPADVILNRIDSIIVKHSSTDRKVTLEVKKGVLATNPVAPTLTKNEEVSEICLANILVNKNITSITTNLITDTRPNSEVCGWVAGLIKEIDTTTLYNQYEAAQNEFINEKTNEIEEWQEEQQTSFDNWFTNVKDDVRATTLYREYQAVYKTSSANEQVITIPSSINYSYNGLDVLNVLVNGMLLAEGVGYSINSDGSKITLADPLDVIQTEVIFVNKKSIDGQVAENVVVQVEELQTNVNNLATNMYLAKGSGDNIALSNIVKDFLNGTGDYSGASNNASMKINVSGVLEADTLIEEQMVFDFHGRTDTNRKVILDFGNATIKIPASPSETINILAIFGAEDNVTIENANVELGNYNARTIYGLHGGVIKNSQLIINSTGTIYGAYNCSRVLNNDINVSSGYSIYASNNQIVMGNRINKEIYKTSSTVDVGNVLIG